MFYNSKQQVKYFSVANAIKSIINVSWPKNVADISDEVLSKFDIYRVSITQPEYDAQTHKLVDGDITESVDAEGNKSYSMVRVAVELTQEEIDAKANYEAGRLAQKSVEVRKARDKMLMESDWTQVADAPVDKAAWATYRQALRDISSQEGFPLSVEWPTKPE